MSSTESLKNSAFVFVKPHANTAATQDMVRQKLVEAGIEILSERDIDGGTIDEKKLIDQHYYAIASKATILSADKIPGAFVSNNAIVKYCFCLDYISLFTGNLFLFLFFLDCNNLACSTRG
jgi:hypothetical protein